MCGDVNLWLALPFFMLGIKKANSKLIEFAFSLVV